MNKTKLNLAVAACLPVALMTLTSCSTEPKPAVETASVVSYQPGVPGGIKAETHKLTARVTAIDAATRKVTLETADGNKTVVKCGPEIVNFDQIRLNDRLTVVVTEEIVAYLANARTPADGGARAVVLAPRGAKPGGVVADTVQVTAKVVAIDLRNHKATLQFPDGSTRTVAVRSDVDLSQRRVGEEVIIRVTEVVAVQVSKPN
jgi:hypothetical protein